MGCGLERGSARRTPGCHDESFHSGPRHLERRGIFFLHSSCCRSACKVCHLRGFYVLMTIVSGRRLVGQSGLSFREAETEQRAMTDISISSRSAGSRLHLHWFTREPNDISAVGFCCQVTPTDRKDAHMANSTAAHLFFAHRSLCPCDSIGKVRFEPG
jgi:hypothetical protein